MLKNRTMLLFSLSFFITLYFLNIGKLDQHAGRISCVRAESRLLNMPRCRIDPQKIFLDL